MANPVIIGYPHLDAVWIELTADRNIIIHPGNRGGGPTAQDRVGRMLHSTEATWPDRREVVSGLILELEKKALITVKESHGLIGILESILTGGRTLDSAHHLLKQDPGPIAEAIAKAAIRGVETIGASTGRSTSTNSFTYETDTPTGLNPYAATLYGIFLGAVIGGLLGGPPGVVAGAYVGAVGGAIAGGVNSAADRSDSGGNGKPEQSATEQQ